MIIQAKGWAFKKGDTMETLESLHNAKILTG